jgi:hypothetical protein
MDGCRRTSGRSKNVAARYGDASVIAAVLTGGTLAGDSVDFRRVPLREFIASLATPGTASHYVMAPTGNLPEQFHRDPPRAPSTATTPGTCARSSGREGGDRHADAPRRPAQPERASHRPEALAPLSARRPRHVPRAASSLACRTSPRSTPRTPTTAAIPRFREQQAVGGVVGEGETLFIPHGWWHHTRSLEDGGRDQLLVGWPVGRRRRARVGRVQASPRHPPRRVGELVGSGTLAHLTAVRTRRRRISQPSPSGARISTIVATVAPASSPTVRRRP